MTISLRTLRLRGVWLLVVPFILLVRPTPGLLLLGWALASVGLTVRGWAAGSIHKDRELSTGGPYAHTRNPLYLGSFLIGLGVAVAGGRWELVVLFGLLFTAVYRRVMRHEARLLQERFGERYTHWSRAVPLFFPRAVPQRAEPAAEPGTAGGFTLERWRRNREYEALLSVIAGFLFLTAKLLWM